jgi:hypothetical protein
MTAMKPIWFSLLVATALSLLVSACSREQFGKTGDSALRKVGVDTYFSINRIGPGRFDIQYNQNLTAKGRVLTSAREECPGQFNSATLVKARTSGEIVTASFYCTGKSPTPTQTIHGTGIEKVEIVDDGFGRFFVFYDRRRHTYGEAKQKAFFRCQSLGKQAQIVRPPVRQGERVMRTTFICR